MPEQSKIYLIDKEPNADHSANRMLKAALQNSANSTFSSFLKAAGNPFHPPHGFDRVPVRNHAQGGDVLFTRTNSQTVATDTLKLSHTPQALNVTDPLLLLLKRKRYPRTNVTTACSKHDANCRTFQLRRPSLHNCPSLELSREKPKPLRALSRASRALRGTHDFWSF